MNIEKLIEKIADRGKPEDMSKLADVLKYAIEHSEKKKEYELKLHIILNGYHFDACTLEYALCKIGGAKITCDEVERKLNLYRIDVPEDITTEDICYALNMFYSDYSELNLSDEKAIVWSVLYCSDEDYPVKNGKCFAEWSFKESFNK